MKRSLHREISSGLLGGCALAGLVAFSSPAAMAASALPQNGQYVAGSGAIAKKSNGLTVNQASHTGIIDWSSFSIGKGQTVRFNNGGGATLNRVTGGNLSNISGALRSNGSVYLINPLGVIVSRTGRVTTQGDFVASSRDISDDDFLNGKRRFSGSSKGDVSNAGHLTSANGDVALIGRNTVNSGAISAANGSASLNAGNTVLLAPSGSNARILVASGHGDAANSGTIAGAQAQLNAAGGNVYALAGNNGGIVRATGTQTIGGHVWLTSKHGDVKIDGNVAAQNANGSGGAVTVRGADIAAHGHIDASADAAHKAGGAVSIIASHTASIGGAISAEGGAHGKGGHIETSGAHVHVRPSARVSTLAKRGVTGQWLIDPNDFTIAASGGDITGATLSGELASNNITILSSNGSHAGNGDIHVNDAVSWSSNKTLTLSAYRNIDINTAVTASGGGAISLTTGTGTTGDYSFGLGPTGFAGRIDFTGGSGSGSALTINGTSYTLLYSLGALQTTSLIGNFALANSFDATSVTWTPIGLVGALTGLGNTIKNLQVVTPTADYAGLFGLSSGTLRDIGLVGGKISGKDFVGGLVGENTRGGSVIDSYSTASVTGTGTDIGGLVGENHTTGTISGSYTAASVSGGSKSSNVGGLVGFDQFGKITQSHTTGPVSGANDVGGLLGYVFYTTNDLGAVSDSYATGSVTGSAADIGGLVGYGGAISGSHATGNVSGQSNVGGLVGYDDENVIANSFATGDVTGGSYVGGLIGIGSATDSHATGNVTGSGDFVGGLAGDGIGTDSFAKGVIRGRDHVGGLSGGGGGSNSYATGAVTGRNYVGGLAGEGGGVNSYASGNVTGSGKYIGGLAGASNAGDQTSGSHARGTVTGGANASFIGGLVGWNQGTIIQDYAVSSVTGGKTANAVGGLVGWNEGIISISYASGPVATGGTNVGGLVGKNQKNAQMGSNSGKIINSYANGSVQGGEYVGALAGYNLGGTITHTYAIGAVSGSKYLGGLVGFFDSTGSAASSYWDTQTTGMAKAAGNVKKVTGATGKTTAQLQGTLPPQFSASYWGTGSGEFPYLLWQ